MNNDKLVIGLPAGSLADPARGGNLINLLKHAGFPTKGYDKGGPSTFPINAMLVGWDGRPQEFGSQLALGEIDIAIAGDDWIRERILEYKYEYKQDIKLKKVLSLERGGVRIVAVNRPDETTGLSVDAWLSRLFSSKPLVSMVSEMPYLALDWLQGKAKALGFGESHQAYSVQKYRTPSRIDAGILIYEAWGKTEAKVVSGSVDPRARNYPDRERNQELWAQHPYRIDGFRDRDLGRTQACGRTRRNTTSPACSC